MSRKGVVCRVTPSAYYLLTPAGDFVRVKGKLPQGAKLGDELIIRSRLVPRLVALAAAAALILMLFGNLPPAGEPSDYMVALDVNPSFELTYTPDYIVTGVRAFDNMGEGLLQNAELVGMELHLALAEIVGLCTDSGLGQGNVAVTRPVGVPLDTDLLTGALEVRGLETKIHLVVVSEYESDSVSPLRKLLQQQAASDIDWEQPGVLFQALGNLNSGVQVLHTESWQDSALVQHLVEKYSVGSALIGEMMAEMSADETSIILAAARAKNQSPRELWQQVIASGQTPGKYFANQNLPDLGLAEIIEEGEVLDLLGSQYNIPAGRLLSLVRRGYPLVDVAELLAIAKEADMNLQNVVNLYDRVGQCPEAVRAALAQDPQNKKPKPKLPDESSLTEADLARTYGINRGEISRFTAKGFRLSQVEALLYLANELEQSPDAIFKTLERAKSWTEFVWEMGLDSGYDWERIAPLKQRLEESSDLDKPKLKN